MNHGGLGYIARDGHLELPPDLLELLSLNVSRNLYVAFYPPKENDSEYKNVYHPYNFMLSPIHNKYWPVSARLLMFCKHLSGSYKFITQCLQKNNVSIIHSEVSKTGHRYASLSLFIVFEDLLSIDFNVADFDEERSVFQQTANKIKDIEEKLQNECGNLLFSDKTDVFLDTPINIKPNTHLSFFHYLYLKKGEKNNDIYKPFSIAIDTTRGENNVAFDLSNQLRSIVRRYTSNSNQIKFVQSIDELIPAVVFANLDTRLLCIRLVIIPNMLNHLFSVIFIKYTKESAHNACRGLIAKICELFYDEFRIWWSFNNTYHSNDYTEDGYVVFLLENMMFNDSIEVSESKFKHLKTRLEKKKEDIYRETGIAIDSIDNFKFEIELAKARINQLRSPDINYKFQYDVFISADVDDEKIASDIEKKLRNKGLRPYYHKSNLKTGENFSEIVNALLNSRELCLVFSNNTEGSLWVHQEWGIAWALQKLIIPICSDSTLFEKLDSRIKNVLGLEVRYTNNSIDVEKYAEELLIRKYQYLLFSSWR